MAWTKIPKEHHPLFLAALPPASDVEVLAMFGGLAALVNGNMAGGLFGRSAIVKLAPSELREALALEGAGPFDPMGNGRVMKDTALLPDDVMERPAELRRWLDRALAHARTLPPKPKKGARSQALKKTARIPAFTVEEPTGRTASVPLPSVTAPKKRGPTKGKKAKLAKKAMPKKSAVTAKKQAKKQAKKKAKKKAKNAKASGKSSKQAKKAR